MDKSHSLNRTFKCYFCNKIVKNETEMGHTTVCGSVLLPCPNKCGSYIRRMDMTKHVNECINKIRKVIRNVASESEYSETEISTGTSSSDPVLRPHRYSHSGSPITYSNQKFSFGSLPVDELRNCKNIQKHQYQQIEILKLQNKQLLEWKKEIQIRVNSFESQISSYESFSKETRLHWMTAQQKLMQLDNLKSELEHLRNNVMQQEAAMRQYLSEKDFELQNHKKSTSQDIKALRLSLMDDCERINAIHKDFRGLEGTVGELKAKFASIVFDVRAVSQIASETAEKLEIQARQMAEMKKEFKQLRLDFECIEQLSDKQGSTLSSSTTGHLLWKITECDAKMEDAKTNGSIIKSPVFYSHNYGYKLRLVLFFNGLKKWKDRYTLFCLHVLKGEYDMLLKWPCNIEGTVTLKDLESPDNPKNFTKRISAKRQSGGEETEDPQESSSAFIFIPHATMTKSKYVKEDTFFIEVQIDQNRAMGIETCI